MKKTTHQYCEKKWTQGDEWWIWSHHGSTWKQHVGMVGNGGNRFLSRTHWATELWHSLVGKPIHPSPICAMDCHGPNMVRNGMVLQAYQHKSTITKDSWWWLYQSCVNPMTNSFWRQKNNMFFTAGHTVDGRNPQLVTMSNYEPPQIMGLFHGINCPIHQLVQDFFQPSTGCFHFSFLIMAIFILHMFKQF